MAPFILQKCCNKGQFPLEWDRSHLTTALSGVMPLFRGRKRQKNIYTHTHTHVYTWQIVLSFAGSALPTVTLICSVLSMSTHWVADAPQGYKLTGCVSILYVCGLSICGQRQNGIERGNYRLRQTKRHKEKVYVWVCMWGVCEILRRACYSNRLKQRRQEGDRPRLEALDAGPPIKAKEHKLSPCRLIR